jgi:hypothetical protein
VGPGLCPLVYGCVSVNLGHNLAAGGGQGEHPWVPSWCPPNHTGWMENVRHFFCVCASFSQYSTAQGDTFFFSKMNVNYVRLTCIIIVKRYYFSKLKINQLLIENVVRLFLKLAWMHTILLRCHGHSLFKHDNVHCHHWVRFHIIDDMAQIFSKSLVKVHFWKSEWPRDFKF